MSDDRVILAWPKTPRDASAPLDIRGARRKLEMNQSQFCAAFGLRLGDLRRWERGETIADPISRTLLTLIVRDPDCVQRALAKGSVTGHGHEP